MGRAADLSYGRLTVDICHTKLTNTPNQAHVKEGGSWSRSLALKVEEAGLAAFTRALSGGGGGGGKAGGAGLEACWSLVDMDEHLDDATKDFRNQQIQKLLSS